MKYSKKLFSAADLERIQRAREALKQGKFTVPARESDVEKFQPPALDAK